VFLAYHIAVVHASQSRGLQLQQQYDYPRVQHNELRPMRVPRYKQHYAAYSNILLQIDNVASGALNDRQPTVF